MRGDVRSLFALFACTIVSVAACGGGGSPTELLSGTPAVTTPSGGGTSTTGTTVPEAGTFVKRTVTVGGVAYPYQVFVPAAYTTGTTWPVVMALHGGHGRGSDGNLQVQQGLALVVKAQAATFPAFGVFPQIPAGETFPRETMLAIATAALDQVVATYRIDPKREYLTGISFGGVLAYTIAYRSPTRFAAFVPISCAPADAEILGVSTAAAQSSFPAVAQALRTVPMWLFHGHNDAQFSVALPRAMVAALQSAGGTVKYTEYPTGTHSENTWDTAYATPDLYTWMFAQHR
ncbi:phospholipase/carboxylesterase (plasmid) [Gemmatirosa kalamazoonensis]|uniref:Phospholipase/carboxylesterase n=1 Tax=Gemmatirosa kalamazoonensis TaxID=861299 RepID=W0RSZ0_9BACT|nr:PHB depolymerase family esterase [Gemmatirosa kalamazoonensis]AHG93592.1 phospholipase/carboxylesterase [Gemmatirosa kalamazoonensis]